MWRRETRKQFLGAAILRLSTTGGHAGRWRRRGPSSLPSLSTTQATSKVGDSSTGKTALSENLTKWAYYAAFTILRTARSSRLLTASRLALSSR
jgi:hypothetical protein